MSQSTVNQTLYRVGTKMFHRPCVTAIQW